MVVGDSNVFLVKLETIAGVNLSYANYAAFIADGWALTFKDINNATLTVTYTVTDLGSGIHLVKFLQQSGVYYVYLTVPAAYYSSALGFSEEGLVYDTNYIGSILLSNSDIVYENDTNSGYDFSYIDGDSIKETVQITENALVRIGAANLAACTIVCGVKDFATKNSADSPNATLTTAITSDTSGNRFISIYANTFPSALALGTGETEKTFVFDVALTYSGKTYTGARGFIKISKKAD
jgi:hypothetical protein